MNKLCNIIYFFLCLTLSSGVCPSAGGGAGLKLAGGSSRQVVDRSPSVKPPVKPKLFNIRAAGAKYPSKFSQKEGISLKYDPKTMVAPLEKYIEYWKKANIKSRQISPPELDAIIGLYLKNFIDINSVTTSWLGLKKTIAPVGFINITTKKYPWKKLGKKDNPEIDLGNLENGLADLIDLYNSPIPELKPAATKFMDEGLTVENYVDALSQVHYPDVPNQILHRYVIEYFNDDKNQLYQKKKMGVFALTDDVNNPIKIPLNKITEDLDLSDISDSDSDVIDKPLPFQKLYLTMKSIQKMYENVDSDMKSDIDSLSIAPEFKKIKDLSQAIKNAIDAPGDKDRLLLKCGISKDSFADIKLEQIKPQTVNNALSDNYLSFKAFKENPDDLAAFEATEIDFIYLNKNMQALADEYHLHPIDNLTRIQKPFDQLSQSEKVQNLLVNIKDFRDEMNQAIIERRVVDEMDESSSIKLPDLKFPEVNERSDVGQILQKQKNNVTEKVNEIKTKVAQLEGEKPFTSYSVIKAQQKLEKEFKLKDKGFLYQQVKKKLDKDKSDLDRFDQEIEQNALTIVDQMHIQNWSKKNIDDALQKLADGSEDQDMKVKILQLKNKNDDPTTKDFDLDKELSQLVSADDVQDYIKKSKDIEICRKVIKKLSEKIKEREGVETKLKAEDLFENTAKEYVDRSNFESVQAVDKDIETIEGKIKELSSQKSELLSQDVVNKFNSKVDVNSEEYKISTKTLKTDLIARYNKIIEKLDQKKQEIKQEIKDDAQIKTESREIYNDLLQQSKDSAQDAISKGFEKLKDKLSMPPYTSDLDAIIDKYGKKHDFEEITNGFNELQKKLKTDHANLLPIVKAYRQAFETLSQKAKKDKDYEDKVDDIVTKLLKAEPNIKIHIRWIENQIKTIKDKQLTDDPVTDDRASKPLEDHREIPDDIKSKSQKIDTRDINTVGDLKKLYDDVLKKLQSKKDLEYKQSMGFKMIKNWTDGITNYKQGKMYSGTMNVLKASAQSPFALNDALQNYVEDILLALEINEHSLKLETRVWIADKLKELGYILIVLAGTGGMAAGLTEDEKKKKQKDALVAFSQDFVAAVVADKTGANIESVTGGNMKEAIESAVINKVVNKIVPTDEFGSGNFVSSSNGADGSRLSAFQSKNTKLFENSSTNQKVRSSYTQQRRY